MFKLSSLKFILINLEMAMHFQHTSFILEKTIKKTTTTLYTLRMQIKKQIQSLFVCMFII